MSILRNISEHFLYSSCVAWL